MTLTINYPEKMNLMNEEMGKEFASICEDIRKDESLRAVILTGAGKAFCAGGDLDWLLAKSEKSLSTNRLDMVDFYRLFLKVREVEVPVIAAINGAAIGAGMVLALACDIRLASKSARIGATFVKLGLNPGMGCSWLLSRILGPQQALLLATTGRIINGEDAYRMGLVEGVYEKDVLMDEARKLASEIASAAPLAVRWAKRTVWKGMFATLADHLLDEAQGQAECYATEDFKEGIRAVREKQNPRFSRK